MFPSLHTHTRSFTPSPQHCHTSSIPQPNQLYYGDNLTVLREHIPSSSVDLVYLDPAFNSRADYNVLFAEKDGSQSTCPRTK